MNYKIRNAERQQVPGNSRLFDSRLLSKYAEKTKYGTTEKTIGTLSYFMDKKGLVSKNKYESEISDYLLHNVSTSKNKSCKVHFVNNLLALGFLEEVIGLDRQVYYRITLTGELFFNNYMNDDEKKCVKILLCQLRTFTYPNSGTTRVSEKVKSFAFRIFFRALLIDEFVLGKFMLFKFAYIINCKSLDFNPTLKSDLIECGPFYYKWWQWVVSMLTKVGVLNLEKSDYMDEEFNNLYNATPNSEKEWKKKAVKNHYGTRITLSPEYKDIIEYYYGNLSVLDLFHSGDIYNAGVRHGKKIRKDSRYAEMVKDRDSHTCRLTGEQAWWKFRTNNNPGCEAHHVIPMEHRERVLEEIGVDIDHPDYMITVSIDIHECMHKGRNEDRRELLLQAYEQLSIEARTKIKLTIKKYLSYYGITDKNFLANL